MSSRGIRACVGVGANLGDARATLAAAKQAMSQLPRTQMVAWSPLYRSAPIDAGGPDFVNAVAVLETALDAHDLLHELQRIELAQGRERPYRNAPRTLDLDLLLYGDERIATSELTVPHPRMHERAFVLRPLADVLPDAHIPGRGPLAPWLVHTREQRIDRLPD
jgi:2-amino-4-hydroxy-6-hydroxymethyldihydropteridine diphosphokinase